MKTLASRPATIDQLYQAEQFLARFARLGPSADLDTEFIRWASSKDFHPHDRLAIQREVQEILARRGRP